VEHAEADVCVVGAGFAGLAAARRLSQAGVSTIVLEANDRVGGRTYTEELSDGITVDHGGAWFGPGQDAAYGLASELGVETYPTYTKGANVYVKDGVPKRYKGMVPLSMGPLQIANLGVAMRRLDHMAAQLPVEAPWQAPRAKRWDSMTLATWLDRNMAPGRAKRVFSNVLKDLYTADPAEVSLLYALYLIGSHGGGLDFLFSMEGGGQQDRVVGGTGGLANRVAGELGDAVRLASPVHGVRWTDGKVEVDGAGISVTATNVVIAVPAPLTGRIRFDPPLPVERAYLTHRMPIGAVTKIALVYDDAWWRTDGLNGSSLDVDSLASLTLDGCARTTPPGILTVIVAGPQSISFNRLDAQQRRELVTSEMVKRFGPKGRGVVGYHEHDWGAEDYCRGGYMSHMPPGVLTGFGRALREPVGPIHWAGTETATTSHGFIDGAIRSGLRAANEILGARDQSRSALEPASSTSRATLV
jgi:monoamine oxidase